MPCEADLLPRAGLCWGWPCGAFAPLIWWSSIIPPLPCVRAWRGTQKSAVNPASPYLHCGVKRARITQASGCLLGLRIHQYLGRVGWGEEVRVFIPHNRWSPELARIWRFALCWFKPRPRHLGRICFTVASFQGKHPLPQGFGLQFSTVYTLTGALQKVMFGTGSHGLLNTDPYLWINEWEVICRQCSPITHSSRRCIWNAIQRLQR